MPYSSKITIFQNTTFIIIMLQLPKTCKFVLHNIKLFILPALKQLMGLPVLYIGTDNSREPILYPFIGPPLNFNSHIHLKS